MEERGLHCIFSLNHRWFVYTSVPCTQGVERHNRDRGLSFGKLPVDVRAVAPIESLW